MVRDICSHWIPSYQTKNKSARNNDKFAKVSATLSETRHHSQRCVSEAFEDLCWTQDKSTPHRSETNGIAGNAVHRVKRWYLCSSRSVGSFRRVAGKKLWNASVLCESNKTHWQTETRRMKKKDWELHLMVQCYHAGCILFEPISSKDKKSSSSIWYKDASRKFIEYVVKLEEVGLET